MTLPNALPAINSRFRWSLLWPSLLLLSGLSSTVHAQDVLTIPDGLKESIQSVMCQPPSATTKRLVVTGPGVPDIRPKFLASELGTDCLKGDYVVFSVEVAIYPEAARGNYEKVGSEYVSVMCSTLPAGYHPSCSIAIKGRPAPNSFRRNIAMGGVRANQLPRGGGRIFAGPGAAVSLDNITTFASYDPGPQLAWGKFYVWEVCRSKWPSRQYVNFSPPSYLTPEFCKLVDTTDPLRFGDQAEICYTNGGGYCPVMKRERLATPEELKQHIKGVLDAECRGRGDDHMALCYVVHTDKYIVVAEAPNSPFVVQPYGAGSTWGYVGPNKVVGDRIYPMFSHRVALSSTMIVSQGAVRVEDESSPGLPVLNTYESQERPLPSWYSTGGRGTTPTPGTSPGMPGTSPGMPGSGSSSAPATGSGTSSAPGPGSGSCGVWIPMIGCRG